MKASELAGGIGTLGWRGLDFVNSDVFNVAVAPGPDAHEVRNESMEEFILFF